MDIDFDLRTIAISIGIDGVDEVVRREEPVVIGKANMKMLGSMGHVLVRFWEAQRVLMKKGGKEVEGLEVWLEGAPEFRNVPDGFGVLLRMTPSGLKLDGVLGEGGDGANGSIWPALLRLPGLRGFWEQQLRGSVLETLLSVTPQAWLVDPTPLPPGSVTAGLDVGSWADFGGQTDEFSLSSRWEAPGDFRAAGDLELTKALAAFPEERTVLTRALVNAEPGFVVATYRVDEKGTSLVEAVQLSRDEAGKWMAAPVTGK
ncbi:hypothetical protein FEM03_22475 [Phragmitibacter flavus]|uniref:Uncharacterized protein n=2 Tax=Phragmitibacter flavus TaxID=2576071 RepID=A0A5R8K806_9BACT|nr:hypothetical protein FEM03_22475 [Phragmitibacter flavus]